MSDNSEPPGEAPAGQGMLGANVLQQNVDSLSGSVGKLSTDLTGFVSGITSVLKQAENATAGASQASSGSAAGATAGRASGTGAGGYAAWATPLTTFGQQGGGANNGAGGGGGGGQGGGGGGGGGQGGGGQGGGFTPFGAGIPTNGGGSGGGGFRGAVQVGAGLIGAAGVYGNAHINTFMTMNTAATQSMWFSGLANGNVGQSLSAATSMIYGSGGRNINATAASAQDAATAAGYLSYGVGSPMYNANGSANTSWLAGQSNMYAMGYANPYMTQSSVASAMNSMYSPRSVQMMAALGYKLPATGAVNASTYSPMQVAQSLFSRTFQGKSSVSADTMAAALSQGGSLNSNLQYLAQSAGWSSSTVGMLETYLEQRNSAINNGLSSSSIDTLLSQAARGDKSATSTLAKYGIGASSVQAAKTLQASQTSNLADQSGSFNDALQQSTSLLSEFNQVLGAILSSSGASSVLGGMAGYGSQLGGIAGAAGAMAAMGGEGGGMGMGFVGGGFGGGGGGVGSGVFGTAGGVGINMGMNMAGQYAAMRASRWGAGRITSAWSALRNRFGSSAQAAGGQAAGQGEAAAAAAEGEGAEGLSLGAGLGLGAVTAYGGSHLNNWLASNVYGHSGAGDDWVSDSLKIGGNTLAYAGAGALIGSAVPVLGTAAGAIVGGAIGLGQGLYDWITGGSGYSASNSSPAVASSPSIPAGVSTGSIGGGTDSGTTSTAGPSGVTPAPGAGAATAATISRIVSFAVAQVGKDYVYGATGPDAYDCSGLMMAAYAAGGVKIPRTSELQMAAGFAVQPGAAQPGDLMFPNPGHVMMCIGGGQVVEARHTGTKIWIRKYSPGEYIAARRIIQLSSDNATQNAGSSGGNGAKDAGASPTSQTSGTSFLAAGTSELQAVQANAAASLTDALTASIRLTAEEAPFGLSALTNPFTAQNPFANTGSTPAGATGSSGSTPLNGTVKDQYGHTYRVPTGNRPSGSVGGWISQALSDMGMAETSDAVSAIKTIITGESGGDPWSINLYDSNAAAGHPSEGIMQTIPSTFASYAMAGHKDIWNPVDDIIAGVRYAIADYKSLDNVPGVRAVRAGKPYVGYAAGAWELPGDQVAQLHKGEMVLPSSTAQSVRNAVLSDALGAGTANAQSKSAGVTLNFRAGAIQISMGANVSVAAAQQAGTAIVDAIVGDPRIKAMGAGL